MDLLPNLDLCVRQLPDSADATAREIGKRRVGAADAPRPCEAGGTWSLEPPACDLEGPLGRF